MHTATINIHTITTTLALLTLPACGVEQPDVGVRNLDYKCPRWQCGYNTSEINGRSLQDLHLDGLPNADGVALVGFTGPLGLLGYELDVAGDALVARGGLLGPNLSGSALIGSTLLLELDGELQLPLVVAAYEEVDSWSSDSPPVAAYALVHPDLDEPLLERSLCKGSLVDPLQVSVVILAGERYDSPTGTVIPNQDRWITLACAGSAAAKLALLGYGPNADYGEGNSSSVAQRQATLNMLTANYCGDGHSYTADGTPLQWENQSGSVALSEEPGASEAVWGPEGALCLDTPRLVERSELGCELPTCADFSLDEGEWMTYSPAPN